ncbi:hypothetical protein [Catellatospora coxensis]|uniref:Uncharacterized protein n=1 Tax=Catellatospora coxensis TaxID=310354 RepID=A0A8J3L1H1_9ACTN|nr:hypothetical protein [Catellatospora coxensis]GIG07314.1 hypothetical protein Cco03nite_40140 [Catellatospora coxensis]
MTENPSAPDPMSTPEGVPTQASAWRNGLTAVTALLAAALIVRGPGDLADLHVAVQVLVAALLVAGFALLVRAILVAAAAATAGSVAGEVAGARRFAVAGVALVGFAVLGGWLAPAAPASAELIQLTYDHGIICGLVSLEPDGYVTVLPDPGQPENRITAKARTLVPISSIHGMTEVGVCEPPATLPTPAP